jgi:hypothetical protein
MVVVLVKGSLVPVSAPKLYLLDPCLFIGAILWIAGAEGGIGDHLSFSRLTI